MKVLGGVEDPAEDGDEDEDEDKDEDEDEVGPKSEIEVG